MGDLESLLLVLAAIYLTECGVWIQRGGVVLHNAWGRNWRWSLPGALLGNARGAFFFANPLPPLGTVFLCPPSPVSLSPSAMLSFTAVCLNSGGRPPQLARFVRYDEARTIVVEGRSILVNDTLFVKAPSTAAARRLAGRLRKLKSLTETDRAAAIRQALAGTFDTEEIRRRWQDYQARSKTLRLLASILFVYLFVLAPALLWRFGFPHAGPGVAGGLLIQTFSLGWLFRRAHQALFPDGAEERFTPFLTMLLAPPTAIRAPDLLARRLLEEFHPLAVTQVLCPSNQFKLLARLTLLDARHPLLPLLPSSDSPMVQTEEWFRRALLEENEKAVERAGLKLSELLLPPSRSEAENRSYCPRCGAQFVTPTGACGDCGGRPLIPIP